MQLEIFRRFVEMDRTYCIGCMIYRIVICCLGSTLFSLVFSGCALHPSLIQDSDDSAVTHVIPDDSPITLTNQALELDPDFGLAYSALAFTHMYNRDFDKALTASGEAISVQPNDPYVAIYHAFILCANGQPEEGIPFATRAIRLDPVFPRTPYRNILGVLYFHSGQYKQALASFVRSNDLGGPSNPGILAYQTASYVLLDRDREAKTSFDLLGNFNGGFNWRGWLRRAYKNEQYAEQVLQPLGEFERDLKWRPNRFELISLNVRKQWNLPFRRVTIKDRSWP